MGVGNSKFFLCFPKSHKKMNPPDNTTANTQIFIERLDGVDTIDAMAIKSYLRGGVAIQVCP